MFAKNILAPTDALTQFSPPDLRVDSASSAATAAVDLANVGSDGLGAVPAPYGPR